LKDYLPFLNELAGQNGESIEFHRIPIKDFSVPDTDTMVQILETIDEILSRSKKLYIHCWGGIGRTGMAVGCFLKKNGMADRENVIEKIAELRKNDAAKERQSPETEAQIAFVKNF